MPSPFPGMDPYLEAASYWPDFHNRLATNVCEQLNGVLPRAFFASVELTEVFELVLETNEPTRTVRPDLTIEQPYDPSLSDSGGGLAVAAPAGVRTAITEPSLTWKLEPLELATVEIRESRGHRVVTQIKILSPANKRPGRDRNAYLTKRESLDKSDVSLVEIDLLRDGLRPDRSPRLSRTAYYVLCRQAPSIPGIPCAYQLKLNDVLPVVPVPLRAEYDPHPLDLQHAFTRTYDGGGYDRGKVDYAGPASPPLEGSEAEYADAVLTRAGLRKAGTGV